MIKFLTDATGLQAAWLDLNKEILHYAGCVTNIQVLWFTHYMNVTRWRNCGGKNVHFVNTFCLSLYKNPALFMLGIILEDMRMSQEQMLWCRLAMASECRVILRHWKSDVPSS